MMDIPAPVIYFGISALFFIVYGLQAAHIYTIGFDSYIKELIKKFDLTPKEAQREARLSFWFNWLVVCVSGVLATAFLAQSFQIMFKF